MDVSFVSRGLSGLSSVIRHIRCSQVRHNTLSIWYVSIFVGYDSRFINGFLSYRLRFVANFSSFIVGVHGVKRMISLVSSVFGVTPSDVGYRYTSYVTSVGVIMGH